MINLDEKFHNYLGGKKHFRIDGVNEPLTGYGYNCDGSDIIGYWVNTTTVSYTHLTLLTTPYV